MRKQVSDIDILHYEILKSQKIRNRKKNKRSNLLYEEDDYTCLEYNIDDVTNVKLTKADTEVEVF